MKKTLKNRLLILIPFLFLLGIGIGLNHSPSVQPSAASLPYNAIFVVIMSGFGLFAAALVFALKFWAKRKNMWLVFVSAYGLPLLAVMLVTLWLNVSNPPELALLFDSKFFQAIWQPLYYGWYTLFLLFSLWFLLDSDASSLQEIRYGGLIEGLLTGLGVGLCGAFLSEMMIHQGLFFNALPQPPAILTWMVFVFSVTLTPYAVQRFYRLHVEPEFAKRFPKFPAAVLSAALFALVQVKVSMFPIAFASGLVFSYLYQRQQLWPAVAAHAACNLVLFVVGWYLVF